MLWLLLFFVLAGSLVTGILLRCKREVWGNLILLIVAGFVLTGMVWAFQLLKQMPFGLPIALSLFLGSLAFLVVGLSIRFRRPRRSVRVAFGEAD